MQMITYGLYLFKRIREAITDYNKVWKLKPNNMAAQSERMKLVAEDKEGTQSNNEEVPRHLMTLDK